jgi:DNA-binding transcriptional LysR family regulator
MHSMLLDPVLLRTFAAVCATRSFSKAAALVNLTRSAVSLQIKKLEAQVDLRLLDREGAVISPTEDGEVLLSYARRILDLNEEAASRLRRDQPRGLIRLGAPEYFHPQTLASLLGQFTTRYPAVELQIEMGIGPDIAAAFDAGRLDLAIINQELGEGSGTVLQREQRVWAAVPSVKLAENAAIPLALFPPHCGWRQLALSKLDAAGRRWMLTLQSAGVAGILAAVEAGLAISIFAAHGLPKTIRVLQDEQGLPPLPDFEYVLRRRSKASAATNALAEVIIDYFQLSAALRGGHSKNAQDRRTSRKTPRREAWRG